MKTSKNENSILILTVAVKNSIILLRLQHVAEEIVWI